ncbi:putative 3,4-dihydroxyphenylacetate 2,3-dioxygenase [Anopheles sinensis]|uniref:Putative 3,4-dihydroxyphenylacetate 2,3-dioxygenase n=1 Tax=Anopheles sinensis TaxID=74873 RepID=A0A084VBP6_ANOSI|nr:putative 3,4-dihydroxyphenylacetate 2,3-dioxygenase [Anopheles sinensis]
MGKDTEKPKNLKSSTSCTPKNLPEAYPYPFDTGRHFETAPGLHPGMQQLRYYPVAPAGSGHRVRLFYGAFRKPTSDDDCAGHKLGQRTFFWWFWRTRNKTQDITVDFMAALFRSSASVTTVALRTKTTRARRVVSLAAVLRFHSDVSDD